MSLLVHLNSLYRPNPLESACDYQTRLLFPTQEFAAAISKCRLVNCIIPQSMVNLAASTIVWSEPSGAGGAQVQKSATIPPGQYTLDTTSFSAMYTSVMNAASGLASPSFSLTPLSYDSKLQFNVPTSGGTAVSAWQILWSKSSPALAKMCGFTTADTVLAGTAFVSPNTYNLSIPQTLYLRISGFPQTIIPGIVPFAATFPISTAANSQLISAGQSEDMEMSVPLGNFAASQPIRVQLLRDDSTTLDLRGQDYQVTLKLMA